jgi:hypothetical protein
MTFTLGFGELIDTWPPIIWNGFTSAKGLIPPLGNVDLPSMTVSKSTNGPLLDGDVVLLIVVGAAVCEVPLMTLFTSLLILTVF